MSNSDLFYQAERVEVIGDSVLLLGDCRALLPQLDHFDLILTDPPYGINIAKKGTVGGGRANIPATKFPPNDWDKEPPPAWLFELIQEKSKNSIIWGGNYFELPRSSCWLVWDKNNGKTSFADCELAWTDLKRAVRMKKYTWSGFRQEDMKNKEKRVHPTQKPVPLMNWCLDFIPKAKTVCDPFMGSGSTGVACVQRGLSFLGIEQDEHYFDIACGRITEAYQKQGC